MTGDCCICHARCVAIPGPSNNSKRLRASTGWRIGYVIEGHGPTRLMCADCMTRSLPSNIAA